MNKHSKPRFSNPNKLHHKAEALLKTRHNDGAPDYHCR